MGKYSGFKSKFTKVAGEPDYQDKVNGEKDRIKALILKEGKAASIKEYASYLLNARIEKARLEKLEKVQNLTIEAMTQVMVELLDDQELTVVKMDNGVSMSIKDDLYCQVENKHEFHIWISENGLEDLLSVNYQTMSSLVKKRLTGEVVIEAGEGDIPPGINVYFKQGITVRGAKNLGLSEE